MSKTYRDKIKGLNKYYNRQSNILMNLWFKENPNVSNFYEVWVSRGIRRRNLDVWNNWYISLTYNNKRYLDVNYNKNPCWWNHLHTITPSRRKTRDLLKLYFKTNNEDIQFPDLKKPLIYYW